MKSKASDAKKFWGIFGIGCGLFVLSLDWSIVNNALPSIQKSLNTSFSQLQWIMNIFALAIAVLLVTMGRLADAFGRKKLFIFGLGLAAIASLGAALSPTPLVLIMFRLLQGASAATIVTSSQSLITHAFPENMHGKAMGIWATIIGAGLSFGPVLGGLIIQFFSWHWIFFFNIPALLISFLIVTPLAEESRNHKQPAHIDFPGISLFILTLGSFVFATIQAPIWGWSSPVIKALYIFATLTMGIFIFVECRVKSPLIEFHLFKNKKFFAGALTKFALVFMVWGIFFLMPLYFQNIQKKTPAESGLLLLAITLSFTFASHLAGRFSDRINKKYFLWIGLSLVIFTLLFQLCFQKDTSTLFFVIFFIFLGLGWGLSSGPGSSMGIASLPRHVSGVASGTLVTVQEVGGAIGLSVVGTVFKASENAYFENQLHLSNLNLSPESLSRIQSLLSSSDQFFSSLSHYPVPLQKTITTLFQDSFMHGLHRGLWVVIGVMFVSLCLIFLFTRRES